MFIYFILQFTFKNVSSFKNYHQNSQQISYSILFQFQFFVLYIIKSYRFLFFRIMIIIFFFLFLIHLLIIQALAFTFPTSYPTHNSIYIPNSISIGQQSCKQIEVTTTKIFCLCNSNVIRSWNKNGTGFIQNTLMKVSPWTEKIHQFQITKDETELIFFQVGTTNIYQLSTTDLSLINMMAVNGTRNLTGVIKTSNNKLILTFAATAALSYHMVYHLNLSDFTWSPNINVAIVGQIKVKTQFNQHVMVLWNSTGRYYFVSINGSMSTPAMSMSKLSLPTATAITTSTQMTFSSDGTRLVVEHDDLMNLFVYNLCAPLNMTYFIVQVVNKSISYVIEKVQFVDTNSIIAVYHGSIVSYFYVDTLIEIISIDYGIIFSPLISSSIVDKMIYQCVNDTITVRNTVCPTLFIMNDTTSLICYQQPVVIVPINNTTPSNLTINNTLNLTILNQTNHTVINNTLSNTNITNHITNISSSISLSKTVQFYSNIQSYTLGNQVFRFLNSVPGSRKLLKPIFTFFGNFDDLWLYNYIDVTYNDVMQSLFNTIQSIQQQKWQLVHFHTIWQKWFGLDIQNMQSYFNNSHRLSFTSDKFYQIQSNANGYILNTLQFFLSNFILVTFIFIIGHILYRIFYRLHLKVWQFFSQFHILIAFLLFCLDGNIQYMVYLMGFETDNLWYLDYTNKLHQYLIVLWFFVILFIVSTIYFFFKYIYKKQADEFYQNCQPNIRGILYLKFVAGIRNILLGMVHYLLPQSGFQIYSKFLSLIIIEIIFLVGMINCIKMNLFVYKARQCLTVIIGLLRLGLILIFILDFQTSSNGDDFVDIISNIYAIMLSIYISCWLISMMTELTIMTLQIKRHFKLCVGYKNQKIQNKYMASVIIKRKNHTKNITYENFVLNQHYNSLDMNCQQKCQQTIYQIKNKQIKVNKNKCKQSKVNYDDKLQLKSLSKIQRQNFMNKSMKGMIRIKKVKKFDELSLER